MTAIHSLALLSGVLVAALGLHGQGGTGVTGVDGAFEMRLAKSGEIGFVNWKRR